MITLKEALINKSSIKNVKHKEKLWILVPDGENPLIPDAEYDDCTTMTNNSYYMYVLTNEQIKDIFERYPNWNDVVIYEYKGKLDQYELLNDISLENFEYYNATTFLGGHQISKEKLLKTIK